MKIFWSWQSDTPGKTGRHFVRGALESAINELKADGSQIADSDRPEDLHLDHDRKGVKGSPDLFATIVNKIRNSTIFVADVTPIAATDGGKKVMNPNVAIELGVALEALGSEGVLFILNTAFGDRESIPFDLSHKAGPIMYELPANSSPHELEKARRKLVGALKEAIKLYVIDAEKSVSAAAAATPFDLGHDWKTQSSFVLGNSIEIVSSNFLTNRPQVVQTRSDARFFLRVYPLFSLEERSVYEISTLVTSSGLAVTPFYFRQSMNWGRDHEGLIIYSILSDSNECPDYVKVFSTGQIWAVLHYAPLLEHNGGLPIEFLMNLLITKYVQFSNFLSNELGHNGDIGYIAGITEIQGLHAVTSGFGMGRPQGKGLVPAVIRAGQQSKGQTEVEALRPFVTKVWESFGLTFRPFQPLQ